MGSSADLSSRAAFASTIDPHEHRPSGDEHRGSEPHEPHRASVPMKRMPRSTVVPGSSIAPPPHPKEDKDADKKREKDADGPVSEPEPTSKSFVPKTPADLGDVRRGGEES
jgi:hypothetical protein